MRRTVAFPLLVALAALTGALPGTIAEEEASPSPAEQFSRQLDRLPAPTAEAAFRFEGAILAGEQRMGTVKMAGVPTDLPSGARGWRITESVSMMGGQMMREAEALLDRRLQPIEGRLRQQDPGEGPSRVTWSKGEAGFTVVRQRGDADPDEPVEIAHEGDTLTSITALWLFCSLSLGEKGSYATRVFEPAPSAGESTFEDATWSLEGEGTWLGEAAVIMRGEKESVAVEAGFDPATRAMLGADFRRENGMVLAFRPASEAPTPAEGEDPFAAPATSAENAALTAAMAFATGDVDLVDEIVHWPTVYDGMKAEHDARTAGVEDAPPFPDAETLRGQILANLKTSLPTNPRPMIEAGLKMVKAQLVTEALEGEITRVKFPAMFQNMVLDVGERDGKWYLVRFPR